MRDDFGIKGIVPIKVALTYDQVQTMNLVTDQLPARRAATSPARSDR
jgi:hypothetical protein